MTTTKHQEIEPADALRYLRSALAAKELEYYTSEFDGIGGFIRLTATQIKQRKAIHLLSTDINTVIELQKNSQDNYSLIIDLIKKWEGRPQQSINKQAGENVGS